MRAITLSAYWVARLARSYRASRDSIACTKFREATCARCVNPLFPASHCNNVAGAASRTKVKAQSSRV